MRGRIHFRQSGPVIGHVRRQIVDRYATVLRVLEECSSNQSRAAEALDIDRVTLHLKLKRYG
jgi:DNA-binding protein Fis